MKVRYHANAVKRFPLLVFVWAIPRNSFCIKEATRKRAPVFTGFCVFGFAALGRGERNQRLEDAGDEDRRFQRQSVRAVGHPDGPRTTTRRPTGSESC